MLGTKEVPGVSDSVAAVSRTGGEKVDWGSKQAIGVSFPAPLRYNLPLSKGIDAPLQDRSCRVYKHRSARGADSSQQAESLAAYLSIEASCLMGTYGSTVPWRTSCALRSDTLLIPVALGRLSVITQRQGKERNSHQHINQES